MYTVTIPIFGCTWLCNDIGLGAPMEKFAIIKKLFIHPIGCTCPIVCITVGHIDTLLVVDIGGSYGTLLFMLCSKM